MRGPRHSRVSPYASPVRYEAHDPGLLLRSALVLAADRPPLHGRAGGSHVGRVAHVATIGTRHNVVYFGRPTLALGSPYLAYVAVAGEVLQLGARR